MSIYSRSHDLCSTDVRRIVAYAAENDLSARLIFDSTAEPYVGRLQAQNKNRSADANYIYIDKKFGAIDIELDKIGAHAGFNTLEIYSDDDMRRRGFAGTNHTDYTEISVVEMANHIITTLDV